MASNRKVRTAPPSFEFVGWVFTVSIVHHRGDPNRLPPIELRATEHLTSVQLRKLGLGDPRGVFGRVFNGLFNRLAQYMGTKYSFGGSEPIPLEEPGRKPMLPNAAPVRIHDQHQAPQTVAGIPVKTDPRLPKGQFSVEAETAIPVPNGTLPPLGGRDGQAR